METQLTIRCLLSAIMSIVFLCGLVPGQPPAPLDPNPNPEGGTIDIYDYATNELVFNNFGTINFEGWFFNWESGSVDNSGTVNNLYRKSYTEVERYGIRNHGTVTNVYYAGGTINNANPFDNFGTIDNYGTINNQHVCQDSWAEPYSVGIFNYGTITNDYTKDYLTGHGTINNESLFENEGTVVNIGFMINHYVSQEWWEYSVGIFNNGTITNLWDFSNSGTVENSGTIENSGGFETDGNIVNSGIIRNVNAFFCNRASGGIENSGTIINQPNFGAGWSYIRNQGTINNFDGTIENSLSSFTGAEEAIIDNEGRIFNWFSGAIDNEGTINNSGSFSNQRGSTIGNSGTINNLQSSEEFYIDNDSAVDNTGAIVNNASILNEGAIGNSGNVKNSASGTFRNKGTYNNDGTTYNQGSWYNPGTFNNNGIFKGTGTFVGTLDTGSGTVAPGHLAGTMHVTGDYRLSGSGTLEIQIGGFTAGSFDVLDITGMAFLPGGTIKFSSLNGYDVAGDVPPGQSMQLQFLQAGTVQSFASAITYDFPDSPPYIEYSVLQQENGLVFQAAWKDTEPPVIADFCATPDALWPPNGKVVEVIISGSVTDDRSSLAEVWLMVEDEYGELNDEFYEITEFLDENGQFEIPLDLITSRRSHDRDGHQYTVSICATDDAGNTADPQSIQVVVCRPIKGKAKE